MEGTLAMEIAAALPDKIEKLVLVDALPQKPQWKLRAG